MSAEKSLMKVYYVIYLLIKSQVCMTLQLVQYYSMYNMSESNVYLNLNPKAKF